MVPGATSTERPVRVLVVDDTHTVRMLIRAIASRDPRIEIVGEAGDPIEAGERLRELRPDVMTLDVEMPRMNGLTFLEKVLRHRPMPVVMISSHTSEHSDTAVKALALGAFECFDVRRLRPSDPASARLVEVLVAAGRSRQARQPEPPPPAPKAVAAASDFRWNGNTVVIGSSTGGVETLIQILSAFPENGPPVVIAQHMPAQFLISFSQRLNRLAAPEVMLAQNGMTLRQGQIALGPGGEEHVAFHPSDRSRLISLPKSPDDLYSPSVDVLFSSAAALGRKVVAVMLTGMGRDGADGMLEIRQAGGHTIAQSGKTAVVDGMPKAAREIGAAVEVADLPDIAARILAATCRSNGAG